MVSGLHLARLTASATPKALLAASARAGRRNVEQRGRDVECQWWQGDQYRAVRSGATNQRGKPVMRRCVYAGVAMARALLTNVGLALNFDSASSPANGLLIYSDGAGNIKVGQDRCGSQTNVSTTAFTYSAGARLVCTMNAGALRVYYNDALITTATIVDAGILTGQLHGLFSTDASNTLDDLTIYATGTGGEYSQLDSY